MAGTYQLDKIDRAILEALQTNCSLSYLELAQRVNLSASPCARRVKLMEERGFFRGRVMLLDPDKVGLPVNVFVQVTLHHQVKANLQEFEQAVAQWPEVMECYLMTGDFDYLMRVVVPDLRSYQKFLDESLTPTPGIDNIRSSFSIKQVEYRTALPLNHLEVE